MLKRMTISALVILMSWTTYSQNGSGYYNRPYQIGEKLDFRVKYGWFTIGKASVNIPKDTVVNDSDNYLVHVIAETAGLLGFFNNTQDRFVETVNKEDFKPFYSSQNFQDGRDRDIQENFYDFDSGKVVVTKYKLTDNDFKPPKTYDLDSNAFGMMSSYLYLRNLNFHHLKIEDSVMMNVFFGKKHYDFGLEYAGQEEIKTEYGRIMTHKMYVLFPVTTTFPKARSVIVWTTIDKNQLPLKVEAHLKFGKVVCDLVAYQNLKHYFDP